MLTSQPAMGMKCQWLQFLSLGIWGWVASPLSCRLISPLTVYIQCTCYRWLG